METLSLWSEFMPDGLVEECCINNSWRAHQKVVISGSRAVVTSQDAAILLQLSEP